MIAANDSVESLWLRCNSTLTNLR